MLFLSRKIKNLTSLYPFFFLLHVWSFFFHFPSFSPTNSFPLFLFLPFSFLFCSFSFLSSHSLSFSPYFLLSLCTFSSPFWSIDRMGQKEEVSSPLPQAKCVAFHFPIFIPYFFISFMTSSPTWLNMSHGIMPPMWLNVSHSFYAKCHTLEVPCGIP